MQRSENRFAKRHVYQTAMPRAVRSLENDELQSLLIALLHEWRNRIGGSAVVPGRLDA
jgi:hypothetical protein